MENYYTWLPQVINMSLTASVVILCVLVARIFLRRMPKVFSYVLWGVVLLRLLCPFSFDSALSLFQVMDAPVSEKGIITYVPEDIVYTEYPAVNLPVEAVNHTINQNLSQGQEPQVADSLGTPIGICTNLWIAGIGILWLYGIRQLVRLARRLIGAVPQEGNVYISDYISTPFVLGILRPKIYLPTGLEQEEQEYIILHEKIHIMRFDHIFRLLAFLALSIHWFNPLVWVAFYLSGKDMEMSCDEAVMRKMGRELCADYSASLLKLATGRRVLQGVPLAFGEGNVKQRILNIVRYKKPAAIAVGGAVVIVGVLIFVLASNLVEEEQAVAGQRMEGMAVYENISEIGFEEQVVDSTQWNGGFGTDSSYLTEYIPMDENSVGNAEQSAASEYEELPVTDAASYSVEHREGFEKAALYYYVPESVIVNCLTNALTETTDMQAKAQLALQELYDLTGTQIADCYYFVYDSTDTYVFAQSKEDLEKDRSFLSRSFSDIQTMYIASRRHVWYSSVDMYAMPEEYASMTEAEKAIWFVTHSGQYNGQIVKETVQPYDWDDAAWRVIMENGTVYEVWLDAEAETFENIAGPYPNENINR